VSDGISELFMAFAEWATARGAADFDGRGLWKAETDEWEVEFNRSPTEVEGVPGYSAKLTGKKFVHIAVINPMGGIIGGGANEGAMIRHFQEAAKTAPVQS
tara:strand:+ start:15750 stop:16052 length:303 start_codon:yes stop_codon:yes gene_type:complete